MIPSFVRVTTVVGDGFIENAWASILDPFFMSVGSVVFHLAWGLAFLSFFVKTFIFLFLLLQLTDNRHQKLKELERAEEKKRKERELALKEREREAREIAEQKKRWEQEELEKKKREEEAIRLKKQQQEEEKQRRLKMLEEESKMVNFFPFSEPKVRKLIC